MIKKTFLFILLQVVSMQFYAQNIIENHLIHSISLKEERSISIALPENYGKNNLKYPVLYLLDGEYIFDYAKGVVSFLSNDFGFCPEMIVVSIPNTNRERDVTVTLEQGDPFINFVEFINQELIPYVSKMYRTNNFNILYGFSSSSGICGYFLTEIPDTFDGYILSGTGIGNKFKKLIAEKLNNDHFKQNVFFYANTEKGFREPYLQRYKMVIDSIKPKNLIYRFEVVEESHTNSMKVGLDNGLKLIFSDFYISEEVSSLGYQEILNYFNEINQNYDSVFNIPLGAINELSGILYNNNKKDDAIKLLKYGIDLYPNSSHLLGSLAEIYKSELNFTLAKEYYKKALESSSGNIESSLKYKSLIKEISQ